jgi:SagB-type dehydrogenase family enzyme
MTTLDAHDAFSLSRLYHLNSEPWLNSEAYDNPANTTGYKRHRDAPALALPAPRGETAVEALTAARQSHRAFADRALPAVVLAEILRAAYGVVDLRHDAGGVVRFARSVPSGGALYPLELYVATRRIDGIVDGLYHYGVREHQLEPVRTGPALDAIVPLLLGQTYVANANALLMFAAVFERTQNKYGPRGYRYVLLEAGHAAQNVCLYGTERGLATLCLGGFEDAHLNKLIGLQPPHEGVVYLVAAGTPEDLPAR